MRLIEARPRQAKKTTRAVAVVVLQGPHAQAIFPGPKSATDVDRVLQQRACAPKNFVLGGVGVRASCGGR